MIDFEHDEQLIATHLGDDYGRFLNSIIPPVFMNSLHVLDSIESYTGAAPASRYFYGRVSNPTVEIVSRKWQPWSMENMPLCLPPVWPPLPRP